MKFPIDEQKFINRWLSALNDPDEGDRDRQRLQCRQSTGHIMRD